MACPADKRGNTQGGRRRGPPTYPPHRTPRQRVPSPLCKGQSMCLEMLLVLGGFGPLSSGYTGQPAAGAVPPPAVVVPAVTVDTPPARHCPPGHAKKGWC